MAEQNENIQAGRCRHQYLSSEVDTNTRRLKTTNAVNSILCDRLYKQKKQNSELAQKLAFLLKKMKSRQKEIVNELKTIFRFQYSGTHFNALSDPSTEQTSFIPERQIATPMYSLQSLILPNTDYKFANPSDIAAALGNTCHFLLILSYYLDLPLRYPMRPMSSNSWIKDTCDSRWSIDPDAVTSSLSSYQRFRTSFIGSPKPANLTPNKFPLFSWSISSRFKFNYAVFLLNKNVEQLCNFMGLTVSNVKATLPNIQSVLEVINEWESLEYNTFKKLPYYYERENLKPPPRDSGEDWRREEIERASEDAISPTSNNLKNNDKSIPKSSVVLMKSIFSRSLESLSRKSLSPTAAIEEPREMINLGKNKEDLWSNTNDTLEDDDVKVSFDALATKKKESSSHQTNINPEGAIKDFSTR